MLEKIKIAVSMLLVSVIVACSHTGGIVGGLVPAPKNLKGDVTEDVYHSPKGAFSVRLPHPPSKSDDDRYEWTYSQIREIEDGPVIGVIFGPAAFDLNYYHAVLIRSPINGDKEKYVNEVFEKKAKSRSSFYSRKHFEKFDLNGRSCYYAVYWSGNGNFVLTMIDNETSFYVIEADISLKGQSERPTLEQLVGRDWGLFNEFLKSFTVLNDKFSS